MRRTATSVNSSRFIRCLLSVVLVGTFIVSLPSTPPAYAADDDVIVVSLGDSYSSGEGNEPFYGQSDSDKTKNHDWLAHRSERSWPGRLVIRDYPTPGLELQLADNRGKHWFFVAASGAETNHILDEGQPKLKETLDRQLDVFATNDLKGRVDYVTLTIGGNDLGFVPVIEAAAKDSKYLKIGGLDARLEEAWNIFDNGVNGKLKETYIVIREAAGPQAKIIIVGYPTLINNNGSGGVFSAEEAVKINKAVVDFNRELGDIVRSLNDPNIVFVDVFDRFHGHEAYTADPFINPLIFGAQHEDLVQGLGGLVSAYSMHPNERGLQAYAETVQAVLDGVTAPATSLVFDVSGSMDDSSAFGGNTKLQAARVQGEAFVRSIENQSRQSGTKPLLGVVSFSNDATTNRALTDEYALVSSTIGSLSTQGLTNIYAGLYEGIRQLEGTTGSKVMVFLSDGMDTAGNSEASILTLAQEARDKDITIYTIGFGSSYDLDESLLQQIASITGGLYSHEDPSTLTSASVGVFATMMRAQLSSTSQVLADNMGTVAQNATSDAGNFTVASHGDIHTVLYWPGSQLDLKLTDPDGVEVQDGYPGYTIQNDSIPTEVYVTGAKQGEWNMSVYGAEVSMAEEPYYAITAFDETEAPAITAPAGGAARDDGSGMLFLVIVVAIAAVGGVFALTVRKGKDGGDKS